MPRKKKMEKMPKVYTAVLLLPSHLNSDDDLLLEMAGANIEAKVAEAKVMTMTVGLAPNPETVEPAVRLDENPTKREKGIIPVEAAIRIRNHAQRETPVEVPEIPVDRLEV
jgi:hypothetical protein